MSNHDTLSELTEQEKTIINEHHVNLTIFYSMGNAKINEQVDSMRIMTQMNEMNVMSFEVYVTMKLIYNVRHVAQDISNMKIHDSKYDLMAIIKIISHIHETHDMRHEQNDLEVLYNNELNVTQHCCIFLEALSVVLQNVFLDTI